jgi:hypothetical protein
MTLLETLSFSRRPLFHGVSQSVSQSVGRSVGRLVGSFVLSFVGWLVS